VEGGWGRRDALLPKRRSSRRTPRRCRGLSWYSTAQDSSCRKGQGLFRLDVGMPGLKQQRPRMREMLLGFERLGVHLIKGRNAVVPLEKRGCAARRGRMACPYIFHTGSSTG